MNQETMKRIFILPIYLLIFSGIILSLYSCNNESEKIKKLKLEAEKGEAIAQYLLGGKYYFGQEVNEDDKKAFYWFEKSAKQDIPEAQYFLGLMFSNGEGTSQNNEKSFYWFKKSAEQKYSEAQYELGQIYDLGIGTIKDRRNAIYWYTESANQKNEEAQEYLNFMFKLIGKEKLPNEYEVFKNCKILAEKGNDNAQLYLGQMLFYGNGIETNKEKAGYWISKSYSNGNIKAKEVMENLEIWLYYNGR
jgi:TPR repeat protein